nr:gliding motility-associated C-terminal domain-containing protein [Saprospiraceae bacterium]
MIIQQVFQNLWTPFNAPINSMGLFNCIFLLFFSSFSLNGMGEHLPVEPVKDNYYFQENKGQWADHILYRANLGSNILYIEKGGLTWLQQDPTDLRNRAACKFDENCSFTDYPINCFAFKIHFKGSNNSFQHRGHHPSTEYFNYFRGNDPSAWATDVKAYQKVELIDVYDGIDYKIYIKDGVLKYDFIVHPGAHPSQIQLAYEGLNQIEQIDDNLKYHTGIHDIFEQKPYTYQIIEGKEHYIPSDFVKNDSIVSFKLPEGYNPSVPLVIDPVLIFSTYSGSFADNWGTSATPGLFGELFAAGTVFEPGYPTTLGAFQTSFNSFPDGNNRIADMAITKFSADGTQRIFSTYLGGNRTDIPNSLIVNSSNQLVIMGISSSENYPTTSDAYNQNLRGGIALNPTSTNNISITGADIVVTVLNGSGNALIGSTYIGGSNNDGVNALDFNLAVNYGDQFRGEVIVDAFDNIYVATVSSSRDFPTTSGVFQPGGPGGLLNGVVFSLNRNCSNLRFSTYLGGSSNDAAYSIKIDSNGDLLVAGGTRSSNFPTTPGGVNTNFQGGPTDGFISKLSGDGQLLLASTFIGTNDYDQVYFVDVDLTDRVYLLGQSLGAMNPTEGVYSVANGRQFIKRLSNDLREMEFTSLYGSGGGVLDISLTALMVDDCNRIYTSGWGGEVNQSFVNSSSTIGLPTTIDAFQRNTDGDDFYFLVLEEDATELIYATFFGGTTMFGRGAEHVDGGTSRFSREGTIYQAVCAGCGGIDNFPTTPGVAGPENLSTNCNLGAIKFDFQLTEIIARISAGVGTTGCAPFTVDFRNNSTGTTSFRWDFGDGSTSQERSPVHLYEEEGTYVVQLIALSKNNCLLPDTATLTIEVLSPTSSLSDTLEICDGAPVELNSQIDEIDGIYQWSSGQNTQSIQAVESGLYIVESSFQNCIYLDSFTVINSTPTITIKDSIACDQSFLDLNLDSRAENIVWSTGQSDIDIVVNEPGQYYVDYLIGNCPFSDSAFITFPISPEVHLSGDTLGCEGDEIILTATEIKGIAIEEYTWSTGETGSSITVAENGNYSVEALSFEGCADSKALDIFFIPELPPLPNYQDTLICADGNLVVDLRIFEEFSDITWSDGSSLFFREFTEAGNFPFTIENICEVLEGQVSLEKSEFDLGQLPMYFPNAFSPNRDGINDVFKPEFPPEVEILSFKMQVFDRWGTKVFETSDPEIGWEGTFENEAMDPAVFAWIAEVEFFVCESPQEKLLKGDITILK